MIPIGQYLHLDSPIHRLDPRTKLLGLTVLGILTLLARGYSQILVLSTFLVLLILLSKLPFIHVLKGLKGLCPLFIFTILIHSYLGSEGETLLGLKRGIFFVLQISILTLGAILLNWTTPPLQIVDGLRYIFTPLRFIRVPVDSLCLVLVMAIRFIPTLILEADRLIKAQRARGIEFKRGPLRERVKNSISIIAPLLLNTLRRAENLALTMEIRCFRGIEGRSRLRRLYFKRSDSVALSVLTFLIFFIFTL